MTTPDNCSVRSSTTGIHARAPDDLRVRTIHRSRGRRGGRILLRGVGEGLRAAREQRRPKETLVASRGCAGQAVLWPGGPMEVGMSERLAASSLVAAVLALAGCSDSAPTGSA